MSLENGNNSDTELAEKLKRENPEQFHTLVRMHLSFVLDLHTDDNECVAEKAKFKKWSLFPKKSKCRGVMEGAPLTQEGICQVYQLIEYLSKEPNITQEGIFRRTGSLNRQQELRSLLNAGTTLDLDSGPYSIHDCASVLKGFLAELPEPLLTDAHYPAHCQIAELCGGVGKKTPITNEPRLLRSLQLLLLLLPAENRVLLKDVLELLNLVASYEGQNKMSSDSLATLFTPHLLCPRKLSPEALHTNSQTMSPIVSFMIKKAKKLFDIPPKLATDIRAYFVEREKKKILISNKDLNESVSDGTAVNTVYSFVDRERTAQDHITNPTEAALAQLYAHIQSLPESSKKKKLIKQFNKENGQGTPLQMQRTQKSTMRTKSLGDSIKKHIFQKTLAKNMKKTSLLLTPATTNCLNGTRSSSNEDLLNTPDTYIYTTPKKSKSCLLVSAPKDEATTILSSSPSLLSVSTKSGESSMNKIIDVQIIEKNLRFSNEIEILNKSNNQLSHTPILIDNSRLSNSLVEHKNLWNSNYLTSTPATGGWLTRTSGSGVDDIFTPDIIGRKSMSPITRSARRMSKAMQETMMTPRSRKPVLLISGTNICQLASVQRVNQNITNIIENDDPLSYFNETPSKSSQCGIIPQIEELSTDNSSEELEDEENQHLMREIQTKTDKKISKENYNSFKTCYKIILTNQQIDDQKFQNESEDEELSKEVLDLIPENINDDNSFQDMSKDALTDEGDIGKSEDNETKDILEMIPTNINDDSSFQDMSKDALTSTDEGDIAKSQDTESKEILEMIPKNINDDSSFQDMSNDALTSMDEVEISKNQKDLLKMVSKNISDDCSFQGMSKDALRSIDEVKISKNQDNKSKESIEIIAKNISNNSSFQDTCPTASSIKDFENHENNSKNSYETSEQISQNIKPKNNSNRISFNISNNLQPNLTNSSSLSNTFRDYLVTRSILTDSPADLSFSSQEGDFESLSSVHNISDNKLSDSLLFCLDGNNPNCSDESLTDDSPSRKRHSEYIENKTSTISPVFKTEKHLTLKLRKLSKTGDIVYETSL